MPPEATTVLHIELGSVFYQMTISESKIFWVSFDFFHKPHHLGSHVLSGHHLSPWLEDPMP